MGLLLIKPPSLRHQTRHLCASLCSSMRRFQALLDPDDGQARGSTNTGCDLRLIADVQRSDIWAVFGLGAF